MRTLVTSNPGNLEFWTWKQKEMPSIWCHTVLHHVFPCYLNTHTHAKSYNFQSEVCMYIRAGHAYAEYANDADYAHMRNMRMRMRIENLIHIIHIWIFAKNGNFLGQKWVSLALFSILSAQNIIIVHTSWFYPSSGMKIKSPKSQNFGQEKMIFFYYWCGLCALMRIWCASMRISKNRRMASPSIQAISRTGVELVVGTFSCVSTYKTRTSEMVLAILRHLRQNFS